MSSAAIFTVILELQYLIDKPYSMSPQPAGVQVLYADIINRLWFNIIPDW